MHVHVRVCKVRELQLEYSCMRCSEHEADVKGHRIVQKSTKMLKTATKKSVKKNPKKTVKSVTTERQVACDRRTPRNTRRQELVKPVRKRTRGDTDNADAVPPKRPRSSRSLTEEDIPRIVDAFIAAQDKHRAAVVQPGTPMLRMGIQRMTPVTQSATLATQSATLATQVASF